MRANKTAGFVEVAKKYFELGIPVIPIVIYKKDEKFEKVPLVSYGRWSSEKQTKEEFESLEWDRANGFAIICGHETSCGFICVIDIDLPFDEAIKRLYSWPNFVVTKIERTVSNRLHLVYFSKIPVPSIKRENVPLELRGRNLCVMAPSFGYVAVNDNTPTVIEDAYEYFLELCKFFGYDLEPKKEDESDEKLKKWLNAILNSGKMQIVGSGPNFYYVRCPFHPPDNHPSFVIHRRKYYAFDFHNSRTFSLKELARELDIELDDEKEKRQRILSLTIPQTSLVFEAIAEPNEINNFDAYLLIYSNGGFSIKESYKIGDIVILPRSPKTYPYPPYVVKNLDSKNRLELVELVRQEIERFIDAEPEEKAIFTSFVLLSYVQELFETVPYLYLVGDCESGKSHLLNLMAQLCYRPLAGVSHTAADVYSYLEDDIPLTIIEDEFQGAERDNEKMKIYKSGYKKGARVARVTTFEGGRRIDYFNCFGIKIMAAERLIENKGLMQRCIVVEMVEGIPEKDHYDPEDYERFAWIRSELLKWRMRILAGHETLPKIEIDWLRGRDRELFLPLLSVAAGTDIYDVLEQHLRQKLEERKAEKESSLEAVVCRLVAKILEEESEVCFSKLWSMLLTEVDGEEETYPNRLTARAMLSDTYGRITKKEVAAILKDKLGMKKLKTKRNGVNEVIYIPNMAKLQRAYRKYKIGCQTANAANTLEAYA